MASFTLTDQTTFPDSTTVKVYDATDSPSFLVPVAEGTVSGGEVTFTGLEEDASYIARAEVGGVIRSVRFRTEGATSSGAGVLSIVEVAKGQNYTLGASDGNSVVLVPAPGSEAEAKVTIPADATAAVLVGSEVQVWKVPAGLGSVKLIPAAGVTILFGGSAIEESGQTVSEQLFLVKVAANEWLLHE
jgi:hypothetical protein